MTTKRPIGVDLFSGVGGMSLGFEQAGFDVVAAVEIDPVHAAVHAFNFPGCAVLPRPISQLSGKDIRRAAGIGKRRVDVVFGGPPCQGFSLMGQRMLDDPRNSLVLEFVRVVKELKPSYFVFENVKGLTQGKHRAFLDESIAAFAQIGYSVTLPWRVLNATDYGVPQDRERLILLGHRKGRPAPVYPSSGTLVPTCRDAIADLPDADTFEVLWTTDEVRTDKWGTPSGYALALRCLDPKSWAFGYRRKWDPSLLTGSLRTEHTTISRRRFAETRPGETEPISRFFKLPEDGVSNTLRAGTDSARGAFTSPRPIHYRLPRCITVREMARLHGFPDWFRFHETKWHGARQIGNAVPPPMARAIASSIVRALGATPKRPTRVLDLGDPKLLRMDLSAASRYWDVPVPLRRRDRKSGAVKRRQSEIEALRVVEKFPDPICQPISA